MAKPSAMEALHQSNPHTWISLGLPFFNFTTPQAAGMRTMQCRASRIIAGYAASPLAVGSQQFAQADVASRHGLTQVLGAMDKPRELQGVEFDWFAIDQDGSVALFATAGFGPVPASVLAASEAHDAVGESIVITGFGTYEVWQSYAQAGLYVFDWSDSEGSYVRVSEPSAGKEFKQARAVAAIPGLLQLPLLFSNTAVVSPSWPDGI